jgi:hypothetical protein
VRIDHRHACTVHTGNGLRGELRHGIEHVGDAERPGHHARHPGQRVAQVDLVGFEALPCQVGVERGVTARLIVVVDHRTSPRLTTGGDDNGFVLDEHTRRRLPTIGVGSVDER